MKQPMTTNLLSIKCPAGQAERSKLPLHVRDGKMRQQLPGWQHWHCKAQGDIWEARDGMDARVTTMLTPASDRRALVASNFGAANAARGDKNPKSCMALYPASR